MKCFCRVQEEAGSTGRRKGRNHFLTDKARFPHTADHGSTFTTEQKLHSALKLAINTSSQVGNGLCLGNQGFFGNREVVHFRP
ncbi:hypothetical protein D3C81_1985870 [compost metagenome]